MGMHPTGTGLAPPHVPWYLTLTLLQPWTGCRQAGFWFLSQPRLFCVSGALARIFFHIPVIPTPVQGSSFDHPDTPPPSSA